MRYRAAAMTLYTVPIGKDPASFSGEGMCMSGRITMDSAGAVPSGRGAASGKVKAPGPLRRESKLPVQGVFEQVQEGPHIGNPLKGHRSLLLYPMPYHL